jgi:hypothetical protein
MLIWVNAHNGNLTAYIGYKIFSCTHPDKYLMKKKLFLNVTKL